MLIDLLINYYDRVYSFNSANSAQMNQNFYDRNALNVPKIHFI